MMSKGAMRYGLFASFLALSLLSCTGCEERTQEYQQQSPQSVDEQLIEMHRKNVAVENDRIEEFLKTQTWESLSSDTGLRYWIFEEGSGKPVFEGDRISCEYEMKFLDGSIAYSSEANGLMTFTVGQDNVVSGLHEAAQLMNVGDRAELILPSRLAFGFTGDQVKIPGNAPLWISFHIKELAP
jgi:FKBP-type peptidyl-prolyl cis-trans isomerase